MAKTKDITKISTRLNGEGKVIRMSLAYKNGDIVTYKDDDCIAQTELLSSEFKDLGYNPSEIFVGHLVRIDELKRKKEHHPIKTTIKVTTVCVAAIIALGGNVIFSGRPEDLVKVEESYTGKYLKPLLKYEIFAIRNQMVNLLLLLQHFLNIHVQTLKISLLYQHNI